ncbi:MAG: SpoIVB peptidase S55 [Lachnospiraceae bacterium]|nr:SpoIVB peptidase S55 [Lachnospiraceae bacterium]
MSDKTRKKYRLFLTVALGLVITALVASLSNISYRYVKNNKEVKTSITYKDNNNTHMVWASGEPIGIYVKTKGVMVTGVSSFTNKSGVNVCPCEERIKQGDYISAINGVEVKNKVDFMNKLEVSGNDEISLDIVRDDKTIKVKVRAEQNTSGEYKLGLWVKDDIAGIGTLTYVDNGNFGALGHSINDNDTGEKFEISEGAIYNARLINIIKPSENTPGKIEGVIDYSSKNVIGKVDTNECYGISGTLTDKYNKSNMEAECASTNNDSIGWVLMGSKDDAYVGSAYIISAISGKREAYSINIDAINKDANATEKNLEIRVTDERLLSMTGGIIQGMSGSPIIQNGKLIGAVTHVFVNDSTKGYGIFIEEML